MEAIVLAGGLGTRLRSVIGDAPKCMAEVNGQPFLSYLFQYLEQQGCTKVILSLGYRHEVVLDWLEKNPSSLEVSWVIENEPLGTGGGIQLALQAAETNEVFVLNGDTLFQVSLSEMRDEYHAHPAETMLALKHLEHFERYGTVAASDSGIITAFEEKKPMDEGWINGGIYMIQRDEFLSRNLPQKFSFEKDYLETFVSENRFRSFQSNDYFIDIGIPTDYEKAQTDFKTLFA